MDNETEQGKLKKLRECDLESRVNDSMNDFVVTMPGTMPVSVVPRSYSTSWLETQIPEASQVSNDGKDENAEDSKRCRICLESDAGNDKLIIPCNCKTNPVHRTCLDQWRAERRNGDVFTKCEICNFVYLFERVSPPPMSQRYYTSYVLKMTWEVFKCLVVLFGGILFWGLTCAFLDRNKKLLLNMNLSPDATYLLWGVVLFFLTVDLYGIYWLATHSNERNRFTGCFSCDCDGGGFNGIGGCGECGGGGGEGGFVCCILLLIILTIVGYCCWTSLFCNGNGKSIAAAPENPRKLQSG